MIEIACYLLLLVPVAGARLSQEGLLEAVAAARTAREEGRRDEARETLQAAQRLLEENPGAADIAALRRLDGEAKVLGVVGLQILARKLIVMRLGEDLPENAIDLDVARLDLAHALRGAGALAEALELERPVVERFQTALPEEDPRRLRAVVNLGATLHIRGEFAAAGELYAAALAVYERTRPDDDADLLKARMNLGLVKSRLGDPEGALTLQLKALEVFRRVRAPDDHDLLIAELNVANNRLAVGDITGARDGFAAALTGFERILPEDHSDVLLARRNLAAVQVQLGDLRGGGRRLEEVLRAYERTLAPDHPYFLSVRLNLAIVEHKLGRPESARVLFERILREFESRLPEDNPALQALRLNLGATRHALGDAAGARELFERALAVYERKVPPTDADRLTAQLNLGITVMNAGEFDTAHTLLSSAAQGLAETVGEGHPRHLTAVNALAWVEKALGNIETSFELEQWILKTLEERLADDHADVLEARTRLASTLLDLDRVEESKALFEEVHAAYQQGYTNGYPPALFEALDLGALRSMTGDPDGAAALCEDMIDALLVRFRAAIGAPPRQSRATCIHYARVLDGILFFSAQGGESTSRLFTLLETRRYLATAVPGKRGSGPEETTLRDQLESACAALQDTVLAGPNPDEERASWREQIADLALKREQLQAALADLTPEHARGTQPPTAASVAAALPRDAVAVAIHRYNRWTLGPDDHLLTGQAALLALVLEPGGEVRRIELGMAEQIDALVERWRSALRVAGGRGDPPQLAGSEEDERSAGLALRQAVLDPILASAPEATTFVLALDDPLHLVPLDALPIEESIERVGDRYRVDVRVSFACPDSLEQPAAGEGLVLVGDVDFEAQGALLPQEGSAPPVESSRGSAPFFEWPGLPSTAVEVETIAAQFARDHAGEPLTRLLGSKATKAALSEAVPGRTFVHLATHGWYLGDAVPSLADTPEGDPLESRIARTITGFAPLTICGLCLAGANQGVNAYGRTPGLLTAEELANFDLSACKLAVLSACETGIGLRDSQAVLSLQSALHAAGAHQTLTSLWQVPDRDTQRLMTAFYAGLWGQSLDAAEALWAAKQVLREEGRPVGAWAGLVLTSKGR